MQYRLIGAGAFVIFLSFVLVSPCPVWAGGTIKGKVRFEGTVPQPKALDLTSDPQCVLIHEDNPPQHENLVVNPDGTLKWALVWITDEMEEAYTPPDDAFVIDQKGCMYLPHVSAVMVGQTIAFRNSDDFLHNVRGVSEEGQAFNFAQPFKGMSNSQTFDAPEIGIELKCDVHHWMSAYVHVIEHPFFDVTGDDGSFTITDVTPGTYELEVWHESLGTESKVIDVEEGMETAVEFVLSEV